MDTASCDVNKAEAPRLLLVDDDASVRKIFEQFLALTVPEVDITCVTNGREAVAAVAARDYAVCVLDLHMPEMDGLSAFQAMRDRCCTEGRDLPAILFCSGYTPTPTLEQIVRESPNCKILCKPVRMPEISAFVKANLPSNGSR